ncbi:hypothetical protein [Prosthecobacter sp.]|uniref:hypothetical protein n=1 Tax=Prosthecobacter sp. TaxID=1965333 RepID=UPI0037832FD2
MSESEIEDLILAKLEAAGDTGLTKSSLTKISGSANKVFARLVSERAVMNLGTSKKTLYVLAKHYRPLELAYALLEKKAMPGKAVLFLSKELERGCVGAVKKAVPEAIKRLIQDKKLISVQRGRSRYYLHSASIRSCLNLNDAEPPTKTAEADHLIDEGVIRQAYDSLVQEAGYADVRISDLQQRSGVQLDTLKPWLLNQSREGRIAPTRGDWSLAGEDEKAAAIQIDGQPHVRIRFL